MKMYNRVSRLILGLFLVVIVLAIVAICSGCASPTIDAWADRGQQGIQYAKDNVNEFAGKIKETLSQREASDLDAVFRDIKNAAEAGILNDQWLDDHKAGLKLILAVWQRDRDAVDVAVTKAMDNLDQTAECFDQIKRLRRAFSLTPELQAQVERLTMIVAELIRETKNGRP